MTQLSLLYRRYGKMSQCFLLGMVILAVVSCNSSPPHQQSEETAPSVEFTTQVQAKYAKGFRISYHKNYKLLEILKPFQDQVDTLRYSLVPRELMDQVDVPNSREIPVPIRSLIATSTTHVALIDMLNSTDVITGMVGSDYVYNPAIRHRIKEDKITAFPNGSINKEKVLALQPDLLMISGGQSSQFDNYRVLMDSGINVLVNAEWLETTPLGKAEWVKVMGALLNKEKLANKKFKAVAKEYKRLKVLVDSVDQKPLVINNMPYKGAWFVSGGQSFVAQYLKDAGADYPWFENESTGGLRKGFESVYEVGLKADVWINPGAAQSRQDVLAKDSRFSDFKALQKGQIYNNNKRMSPSGGNDFWESGVVHPEVVLADLIRIFHPNKLPGHELFYYQRLQ